MQDECWQDTSDTHRWLLDLGQMREKGPEIEDMSRRYRMRRAQSGEVRRTRRWSLGVRDGDLLSLGKVSRRVI